MKIRLNTIMSIALVLLLSGAALFAGGAGEAEDEEVVLRLAETHSEDYPTTQANYEFARLVEERSDGRIRIEVYPASQLGEEAEVIEQVQFGAIDMTRVSISPLAAFVPELDALQMPFLYDDADHMWEVLRGDIGRQFLTDLEDSDFVGLSYYDSGARNFYNSVRPIEHPSDMQGMQIRVQESDLMLNLVDSLGAVPTPMPFGEVYSGLQTGVIDGAENNWPSYYSTSHYEVAEYFSVNEHTRVPEITIMSKLVWDQLSEDDQQLIADAAWDSIDFQIQAWNDFVEESEETIRAAGNVITEADEVDTDAFRDAVDHMYDDLTDSQMDVVERIRALGSQ